MAEEKAKAPTVIMKGGTLSSRDDREIEAFMADTRERWAARDEERAQAQSNPRDGFAAEKVHDLGQPGTSAVAVLGYKTGVNDIVVYMQADVVAMQDIYGAPDMAFIFVCPRCVERGIPQTMCQITVRNSNRKWHLDTKSQGKMFVDEKSGQAYRLAGKIYCEEKCRCPRAGCDGVYQFGDWGAKDINAREGTTAMWRVR